MDWETTIPAAFFFISFLCQSQFAFNGMATLIESTVILYDKISSSKDGWKVCGRPSRLPNKQLTKWPQSQKSLVFSIFFRKQLCSTMHEHMTQQNGFQFRDVETCSILYLLAFNAREPNCSRRPWIRHRLPPKRITWCSVYRSRLSSCRVLPSFLASPPNPHHTPLAQSQHIVLQILWHTYGYAKW